MTRARKDFVLGDVVVACTTCEQPFNRPVDDRWRGRSVCIPCNREATKLARRRDRVKNACKRYGITVEKYEEILARQDGCCAVCGEAPASPSVGSDTAHRPNDFLHIDHDHETGVVRGLLCYRCNTGIGCFEDDAARMEAAIRYLRATVVKLILEHGGRPPTWARCTNGTLGCTWGVPHACDKEKTP